LSIHDRARLGTHHRRTGRFCAVRQPGAGRVATTGPTRRRTPRTVRHLACSPARSHCQLRVVRCVPHGDRRGRFGRLARSPDRPACRHKPLGRRRRLPQRARHARNARDDGRRSSRVRGRRACDAYTGV
jgi:hypothetical protein